MNRLLTILLTTVPFLAFSQKKFALIIGIDKYSPPKAVKISPASGRTSWPELKGCKNDGISVKSILRNKFMFDSVNIVELYDTDATRKNILDEMENLLKRCGKNDIAFIYYSGHGSQIKNSKSPENDFLDETIVPANTWQQGVTDIRDKELNKIFNGFIDGEIALTTIFDCCHSGSLTKGIVYKKPIIKFIEPSKVDVADPTKPIPPESRGNSRFLSISSASPSQLSEIRTDQNGIYHSVFTSALLKALNQQSVNSSVSALMLSTTALLRGDGLQQVPVLVASNGRNSQTLFGIEKGLLSDVTLIPVSNRTNNIVKFQAGYPEGLSVGYVLKSLEGGTSVKIKSIEDLTQSTGEVVQGDRGTIKKGDLFKIAEYLTSGEPLLKLYIPPSNLPLTDVLRYNSINSEIKNSTSIRWVKDFGSEKPDVTIYSSDNKWMVNIFKEGLKEVRDITAENIKNLANNKSLFFNIPPPKDLVSAIKTCFLKSSNVKIVENVEDAQYILIGASHDANSVEYALLRKDAGSEKAFEAMPVQTAYFPLRCDNETCFTQLADSIFEYSLKLARIRGWLNITSPESLYFPYTLELRDKKTQTVVNESYRIGDSLGLFIVSNLPTLPTQIPKKPVYVFRIDAFGEMELLMPNDRVEEGENRFPILEEGLPVKEWRVTDIDVGEPTGMDSYFLIASDNPIANSTTLFNLRGVRDIAKKKAALSGLEELLYMGNTQSTSTTSRSLAANWVIRRIYVNTLKK